MTTVGFKPTATIKPRSAMGTAGYRTCHAEENRGLKAPVLHAELDILEAHPLEAGLKLGQWICY